MRRWGKSCWRKRSDSSEACPRRAASGQACCDTAPSHEHVRDRRFETHPGFAGTSFAARDPDATGMSPAGGCRYETRRMCRSYGLDARADAMLGCAGPTGPARAGEAVAAPSGAAGQRTVVHGAGRETELRCVVQDLLRPREMEP